MDFPISNIVEKLSTYYDRDNIQTIINDALNDLGLLWQEEYSPNDYMNICRKLKSKGGNISFCASLLTVNAINKMQRSDTKQRTDREQKLGTTETVAYRSPVSDSQNRVAENIYWVGTYDESSMNSINCFLIIDKKIALIDAGPITTGQTILENISQYVDPAKIDYIVPTHSCIDHVGGLMTLLDHLKKASIVGSQYLQMMLKSYYGYKAPFLTKEIGDALDLDEKTLYFVPPILADSFDTVYIFEKSNRILFSADTFCNPAAKWTLFAKQDATELIKMYHSFKFPSTSLGDRGKLKEGTEALKELKPKIIATSHGLLFNKNINACIDVMTDLL